MTTHSFGKAGQTNDETPPSTIRPTGIRSPKSVFRRTDSRRFQNILANYAGRGVSIGATLIMVPFYLRILGVEASGVVSLLAIAQYMVGLLDFGLGPH